MLLACLGVTAGGISALIYALDQSVKAFDMVAHPPTYKWGFYGMFSALDHRIFDVVGKYIKMCVQLVIVYNIWLIVILWVLHILKKK